MFLLSRSRGTVAGDGAGRNDSVRGGQLPQVFELNFAF